MTPAAIISKTRHITLCILKHLKESLISDQPAPFEQPVRTIMFPPETRSAEYLGPLNDRFCQELFARLTMELPRHHLEIQCAYMGGDYETLRLKVHKLLGAVVYCDAPSLEFSLRNFLDAIKTGDQCAIREGYIDTDAVLTTTIRYSGRSGYRL